MENQFLIAGLPRCRTAWFSVAASTSKSICHHEPTAWTNDFEELQALWRPTLGISMGVSDSALTLQLDRILEEIRPRTLLVERPLHEVMASLRKYLDDMPVTVDYDYGMVYLKELSAHIDRFRRHPLVRTVNYADLSDYETVFELLNWLVPGTEFVDLKPLMHMNVQAEKSYVMEQITKPRRHWYREKWDISRKLPAA